MRRVLLIAYALFSSISVLSQSGFDMIREREIVVYQFDSKVFADLEGILIDTIKAHFNCDSIDLVDLAFNDSAGYINFRFSLVRGSIFLLLNEEDYVNDNEYCFQVSNSNITYLINESEMRLLREIGELSQKYRTSFIPFVTHLNNDCLVKDKKVNLTIDILYTPEGILNIGPALILISE